MIRIATEKDIPAMLRIYSPYVENTTYSFEYTPPTLEQFTERFLKYTKQCPWLVWEEDGTVLGYVNHKKKAASKSKSTMPAICKYDFFIFRNLLFIFTIYITLDNRTIRRAERM